MNRVARLGEEERSALFQNVGRKLNMNPAIIEKDFWVCFTLDYLFHRCKWKDAFVFKGGTSLSKAYKVIQRFSEDIDLILDWRLIQCRLNEPWEVRSKTQQDKFNKLMNIKTAEFLTDEFIKTLRNDFRKELDIDANFHIDNNDVQTVDFVYPQIFKSTSITQEIRLEIGPLAEWTPSHDVEISSYAAEEYPAIFQHGITFVRTVDAERTFWEKTTILHKIANMDVSKDIPTRYSRHYYDLYCMYHTIIKMNAFAKASLLEKDIEFKKKFYYTKESGYDTAKIGTMKLVPRQENIKKLKDDYLHMNEMFYGDIPDFNEMMEVIFRLENEINSLF